MSTGDRMLVGREPSDQELDKERMFVYNKIEQMS